MDSIYHKGNRELQDVFDSRRLADRLHDMTVHDEITDRDRAFIEARDMMFISTVDANGCPTVSYKGGNVGFVKVVDKNTLAFPGYDGNGMFLTAGNISQDAAIGLLFIDLENPMRLRAHGRASVHLEDELLDHYPEAKYIVRVRLDNLFINCPRYIHKYKKIETSEFVPQSGCETPEPGWKERDEFKDVMPND